MSLCCETLKFTLGNEGNLDRRQIKAGIFFRLFSLLKVNILELLRQKIARGDNLNWFWGDTKWSRVRGQFLIQYVESFCPKRQVSSSTVRNQPDSIWFVPELGSQVNQKKLYCLLPCQRKRRRWLVKYQGSLW
jgi:hypothetical protein